MVRLSLVVVFALAALGLATRAYPASEPDATAPTDPACVQKFTGQLCALPDRSGGVCARDVCGPATAQRPCLRCVPTAKASDADVPWVPMIAFGVTVAIIGFVFWFRLKKNWDAAARSPHSEDR